MSYQIGFRNRFQSAHGFVAQNVVAQTTDEIGLGGKWFYRAESMSEPEKPHPGEWSLEVISPEQGVAMSRLGKPVFDVVTLSDEAGGLTYTFPLLPLLDLRRQKKIVETAPVDGNTEVVEYIGKGAWDITIRGILVDMDNHRYPIDQVDELESIFEPDRPLRVSSILLNRRSIQQLYIKDIELVSQNQFPDTQGFVMSCRMYTPVELILLDRNEL